MFIKSLRVQGFKSLADVELTDLDAINVFHGLNDVGKSNILEAIDLLCRLLPEAIMSGEEGWTVNERMLSPYTADTLFRRQNLPRREVEWTATVRITRDEQPLSFALTLQDFTVKFRWLQEPPGDETQRRLAEDSRFVRLAADRHFSPEILADTTNIAGVTDTPTRPENLKRRLFLASAGDDLQQRAQFARLRDLLDKRFGVGQLDAAITTRPTTLRAPDDPLRYAPEVIVRFLRPEGDFAVETVGSGVQQILLLLGQILFNPARIVGIEEPEMNLSPEWQARLMDVFRDLVQPGPGGLDQIFITSHSPEFDCEPNYWKVTYEQDATRVVRMPVEKPGEDLGPYLNSRQQVRIPQRVIDDLGLRHREPVFFYKAEDGRWYIRTKADVLALMESREEYDASTDTGSPR